MDGMNLLLPGNAGDRIDAKIEIELPYKALGMHAVMQAIVFPSNPNMFATLAEVEGVRFADDSQDRVYQARINVFNKFTSCQSGSLNEVRDITMGYFQQFVEACQLMLVQERLKLFEPNAFLSKWLDGSNEINDPIAVDADYEYWRECEDCLIVPIHDISDTLFGVTRCFDFEAPKGLNNDQPEFNPSCDPDADPSKYVLKLDPVDQGITGKYLLTPIPKDRQGEVRTQAIAEIGGTVEQIKANIIGKAYYYGY